jgi:hypothetical protein
MVTELLVRKPECNWLKIGTTGGFLWAQYGPTSFIRGERIIAYQFNDYQFLKNKNAPWSLLNGNLILFKWLFHTRRPTKYRLSTQCLTKQFLLRPLKIPRYEQETTVTRYLPRTPTHHHRTVYVTRFANFCARAQRTLGVTKSAYVW